jgi:hypothetical protein
MALLYFGCVVPKKHTLLYRQPLIFLTVDLGEFGFNKDIMNLTAKEDNYEYEEELKLGISYLTSSKADGFEINFGYSF